MLQIERIQNPNDWLKLRQTWDLYHGRVLTRGFPWLWSWWQAYGDRLELCILKAHEQGKVVGFLPIAKTSCLFTGDTLCWLGSGRACSDNMGILSDPSHQHELAEAFAHHLLQDSSVRWDHLDLDGTYANDEGMSHFLRRISENHKVRIERRPSLNCWLIDIQNGFPQYLSGVSKRVKKMFKEGQAHLSSNCRFEVAGSLEEAIQFSNDIEEMHQERWNERGQGGCFESESFRQFLRECIRSHWIDGKQGTVVCRTVVDGKPGSGMIGFVSNEVLSVYLTGMRPECKSYRLGWLTIFASIELAATLGCHTVDLMRGDEDYKQRLGARPIAQERWIIAHPRLTSRLRNSAYQTARSVRNWAQNLRTSTPLVSPENV